MRTRTLRERHCLRCGHAWFPYRGAKPRYCAKCKSAAWDRPRKSSKAPTQAKGGLRPRLAGRKEGCHSEAQEEC